MNIKIKKTKSLKNKPTADEEVTFGSVYTDHMFIMDYNKEKGWHNPRIEEYKDFKISPAALVFHYGQSTFEGMKAYKTKKGKIVLFRPEKNIRRLNNSNRRLCIPEIDERIFLEAIKELVKIDQEWIPTKKDHHYT